MKRLWTLAALLFIWANSASATVIISNAGKSPVSLSPVEWVWFYNVSLQPGQVFRPGDFFTIYDVPNILFSGADPRVLFAPQQGGSFLTQVAGTTPPDPAGVLTNDDPLINNIKITLDPAATPPNTTIAPGAGGSILGTLTITTNSGVPVETNYAAKSGVPAGDARSTGSVDVAAVPEPSSVTLMMLGLVAFGAVALRRRQGS